MKYGDTLRQRSIPVWETYNVDYNDIKQLIKLHTTKDEVLPTPIPGREIEPKAQRSFEDELGLELCNQHKRIDLFVQSKAGEIGRRLLHLDKQVAQLKRRTGASARNKISVRRLERFSRLEEEILKAGEEVQSLSRFVGAQRLAFQKLLKKYKKWTRSSNLGERFQKEVLDQPASFSKRDFGPLLAQWTEVLAAVRAPFDAGVYWQATSPSNIGTDISTSGENGPVQVANECRNSAADLHTSGQKGPVTDFDTAFAVGALGRGGGKASYWVHPDNLVELHVLLLLHTRLRNPIAPISSGRSSSLRSSPPSFTGAALGSRPKDEIGVIVCDDLQRFAKSRSAATIGESIDKAAASIRYASSGEAVIVVGTSFDGVQVPSKPSQNYHIYKTKLKRKILRRLFEPDADSPLTRSESQSSGGSHVDTCPGEGQSCNDVQAWLTQHREVKPLVQMQMKRTRFVGLGNNQSAGIWATLDRDVKMRKCSLDAFDGNEDLFVLNEVGDLAVSQFPHAILEIRSEGEEDALKLVAALDRSHLTERVRGFSLETHAVATLCQPQGLARPFWLPVLDHDIRKLPALVKPWNRRSSNGSSPQTRSTISSPSTADRPTGSGFSGPLVESPLTSAPEGLKNFPMNNFKKKRKVRPQKEHPLHVQTNFDSPPQPHRYWNEFDDGEEGSPEEAYTIFVDPHAESKFPGAALISKTMATIHMASRRVTSWVRLTPQASAAERQALMTHEYFFPQSSPDDDDDDDDDQTDDENHLLSRTHQNHRLPTSRQYSTIQTPPTSTITAPTLRRRNRHLLHACTATLIISGILLLVAAILTAIGSRSPTPAGGVTPPTTIRAGIVVSVVASWVFGLVGWGIILTSTGSEQRSWISFVAVGLFLTMECISGAALLVMSMSAG